MKKTLTLCMTLLIFSGNVFSQSEFKSSVPEEVHLLQHPFKPMNILLIPGNVQGITARQGDLVMAFADDLCAGAAIVEDISKVLNLVATSTDEVNKGYKAGQAIRLEYHSLADNNVYDLVPIKILLGSMNYEELGTLYAEFKANALSTEEIENTPVIKVYPNPVSQHLHIVLESNQLAKNERINLKLIDLTGRMVINQEGANNTSVINLDVAQLLPGEYTLVVQNGKATYIRKVIKK